MKTYYSYHNIFPTTILPLNLQNININELPAYGWVVVSPPPEVPNGYILGWTGSEWYIAVEENQPDY